MFKEIKREINEKRKSRLTIPYWYRWTTDTIGSDLSKFHCTVTTSFNGPQSNVFKVSRKEKAKTDGEELGRNKAERKEVERQKSFHSLVLNLAWRR